MKNRKSRLWQIKTKVFALAVVVLVLLLTTGGSVAQEKVGPGFTYQGFLKDSGNPANGTYDFEFRLYDAASGGTLMGGPEMADDVAVADGLFTVLLDFGTETFAGNARWLEIGVRPGASTGAYTILTPRQGLTSVPYAAYAERAPWPGRVQVPADNATSTVDAGGGDDVGEHTSITVGQDGLGLISYYDATNGDLKVAHCNDLACTGVTVSTPDSTGDVGQDTSVTIGADGLGLISYYDATNGDLKVAHCNDVACTSAVTTTLDSAGDVGWHTSIIIGIDGLGLISYYDSTNDDLKVAHCENAACTGVTVNTPYSSGDVGRYSSVAIGPGGLPVIATYYADSPLLMVVTCDTLDCDGYWQVKFIESADVRHVSMAIGVDERPLISYYDYTNGDLKVAHCDDAYCSSSTVTTLDDSPANAGLYTSVTIGSDGLGLISYYDATNGDLKVAHCLDVACAGVELRTLDSTGDAGEYSAVTIGSDGLPLISYHDATNGDLKVAHCANAFCQPYFRRR